MPYLRDIPPRARLARRLLRWGGRIVNHTALYGVVIYCIGCVIPTPLDRAPSPTNFAPVFVTNRVTPPFGPATAQVAQQKSFTLTATDPNMDDTLYVRFYTTDSTGGLVWSGAEDQLDPTPEPGGDANLRSKNVTTTPCPLSALQGVTFDYYVVVADRPFSSAMPSKVQPGGLSDSNHWELTCM